MALDNPISAVNISVSAVPTSASTSSSLTISCFSTADEASVPHHAQPDLRSCTKTGSIAPTRALHNPGSKSHPAAWDRQPMSLQLHGLHSRRRFIFFVPCQICEGAGILALGWCWITRASFWTSWISSAVTISSVVTGGCRCPAVLVVRAVML